MSSQINYKRAAPVARRSLSQWDGTRKKESISSRKDPNYPLLLSLRDKGLSISRVLAIILMKHVYSKCSSGSQLTFESICSVGINSRKRVIFKNLKICIDRQFTSKSSLPKTSNNPYSVLSSFSSRLPNRMLRK